MILMDFSYFFLLFSGFWAGFGVLFCRFLRFQLLFPALFWLFGRGLGCCLGDLCGFSYFFLLFSGSFWAGFGVLFWGFLRFQLLFPALFQLFGRVGDAVWGISAVSATFSCSFQAFGRGLGCCFRNFRNYSSTRPSCYATNLWLLYLMII